MRPFLLTIGLLASCKYLRDTPKVVDPPAGTPVVAQLDRGGCLGPCAVYTLVVYQDGTVIYDGQSNVKVTGRRSRVLDQQKLDQIAIAFDKADFASMDKLYDKSKTEDPPTISITYQGKIVTRVPGDPATPPALLELEEDLEIITQADEWTGILTEKEKGERAKRSRFK